MDEEGSAGVGGRVAGDCAGVELDDGMNHREAEAGSGRGAGAGAASRNAPSCTQDRPAAGPLGRRPSPPPRRNKHLWIRGRLSAGARTRGKATRRNC